MDFQFTVSQRDEPHFERRKALLRKYPQLRKLAGYDRKTIFVTIAVVSLQLSLAALVQWSSSPWVSGPLGIVLLSYFLGSVLNHWCSMTIHETSHNLAAKTVWGNRVLAFFANFPLVVPSAMTFHRYHIPHHMNQGVLGKDDDLPMDIEIKLVKNSTLRKFIWLFFYVFMYCVRALRFSGKPNRLEVINWVTQLLFVGGLYSVLGVNAIAYLLLSTLFGHSLHPVAAHFIQEHYVFKPGQETYSYYGPLNALTYNVGYHVEHHDLMNVPGSRLPQIKAIAPEFYDGLESHSSWFLVHFRFIFDKTLGPFSRVVRTAEVQKNARNQHRKQAA